MLPTRVSEDEKEFTPTSPDASVLVPRVLRLDADAAAAFRQFVAVGEELQLMLKACEVVDVARRLEKMVPGCERRGGSGDAAAARRGRCSSSDVDEALGRRVASLRVLLDGSSTRWDRE